jgi:hypothetical protein
MTTEIVKSYLDLLRRFIAADPQAARASLTIVCSHGGISDVAYTIDGCVGKRAVNAKKDLGGEVETALQKLLKYVEDHQFTGTVTLLVWCQGGRIYKLGRRVESSVWE